MNKKTMSKKVKTKPGNDDNQESDPSMVKSNLKDEIVNEAFKLAKNETTSCYILIQKANELLSLD